MKSWNSWISGKWRARASNPAARRMRPRAERDRVLGVDAVGAHMHLHLAADAEPVDPQATRGPGDCHAAAARRANPSWPETSVVSRGCRRGHFVLTSSNSAGSPRRLCRRPPLTDRAIAPLGTRPALVWPLLRRRRRDRPQVHQRDRIRPAVVARAPAQVGEQLPVGRALRLDLRRLLRQRKRSAQFLLRCLAGFSTSRSRASAASTELRSLPTAPRTANTPSASTSGT